MQIKCTPFYFRNTLCINPVKESFDIALSQGDGDYELAKDVIFDDYLWERIKKVGFASFVSIESRF